MIAATLHLFGDGLGWDIEPYVLAGGQAQSFGFYSGPSFDIHSETGEVVASAPSFRFGVSTAWDLTLGIRFP